jgi:sulfur-carrier protein
MAVQVRLFAALREAAGTSRTDVAPGALGDVLAELSARYGERFAQLLPACSILVDGEPAGADAEVTDGAELVLLPPVSGGATDVEGAAPAVGQLALLSATVPLVLVAALLAGRGWFAAGVVIVACWVLLDAVEVLAAAAGRPVLLAAALPAVGLPLAVVFRPDSGWEHVPGWVAASFLLASALMLAFGRRRNVAAGLGATLTAGLLVGLGAAGLLLLRALPSGFRWVLALLVLVAAADLAAGLAGRLLGIQPVLGAVVGAAGAGAVTTLALRPPLDAVAGLMLAITAVVAAVGGGEAHRALARESGRDPEQPGLLPGGGGPLGLADGVLLAAPVAYLVARATGV